MMINQYRVLLIKKHDGASSCQKLDEFETKAVDTQTLNLGGDIPRVGDNLVVQKCFYRVTEVNREFGVTGSRLEPLRITVVARALEHHPLPSEKPPVEEEPAG